MTPTPASQDLAETTEIHLVAGWSALERARERYRTGDPRAERSHRLAINEKARAFQLVSRLWLADPLDERMFALVHRVQELREALAELDSEMIVRDTVAEAIEEYEDALFESFGQ